MAYVDLTLSIGKILAPIQPRRRAIKTTNEREEKPLLLNQTSVVLKTPTTDYQPTEVEHEILKNKTDFYYPTYLIWATTLRQSKTNPSLFAGQ